MALRALGADLRFITFPDRPHVVSDEEVERARAFLSEVRAAAARPQNRATRA
jgi:hypothetical protein